MDLRRGRTLVRCKNITANIKEDRSWVATRCDRPEINRVNFQRIKFMVNDLELLTKGKWVDISIEI